MLPIAASLPLLSNAMVRPHQSMADGFAASQQLHCHHLFCSTFIQPRFVLAVQEHGKTHGRPSLANRGVILKSASVTTLESPSKASDQAKLALRARRPAHSCQRGAAGLLRRAAPARSKRARHIQATMAWGDDDDEEEALPARTETSVNEKGFKTVVEWSRNAAEQKVKTMSLRH